MQLRGKLFALLAHDADATFADNLGAEALGLAGEAPVANPEEDFGMEVRNCVWADDAADVLADAAADAAFDAAAGAVAVAAAGAVAGAAADSGLMLRLTLRPTRWLTPPLTSNTTAVSGLSQGR